MAKQEQSLLKIHPQTELKFEGPFTIPTLSYITLTNTTDKVVYFKLKTTAPKRYCVRPNSGILIPKSVKEVQVLLQPFVFNPVERNKHKFMVQSFIDPEGVYMSPEDLWKSVDPDKIMNHKLRCVFELNVGNEQPQEEADAENVVQIDEKPKKVAEIKAAPKQGLNDGMDKAASEVKLLREEESKLRQENIELKEMVLRLRTELDGHSVRHSYTPPEAASFMPHSELSSIMTVEVLAIAAVAALLGIAIGVFFI